MKYAHLVRLTVFSHGYENSNQINEAFLRFFPFNLEENKINLKKTAATGFNEKKIEVIEVMLTKNNLINQFLESLSSNLDKEQRNLLLNQMESRLDSNLDFFLRFDKDSWIKQEKLLLTDSRKCFHIKISVAAFPKKREIALSIIRKIFNLEDKNF